MKTEIHKDLIIEAFNWSEAERLEMIIDYGRMWIDRYLGHEPIMFNAINKSKTFWKWWVNQWENREVDYVRLTNINAIDLPLTGNVKLIAIELYEETHAANEIKIRPNRYVIAEVSKLIKQEENNLKNIQQNVNR